MHLEKIDDYRWLIPRTYKAGMLTDALVYASEPLLEAIRRDQSLEQAANVAMLPGIVGRALAMPDIHQGYGFPIGGVAAVDEQDGVVSPGGVGFDINCGVRLLSSNLTLKEVRPKLRDLVHQLFRDVPTGIGQSSRLNSCDDTACICPTVSSRAPPFTLLKGSDTSRQWRRRRILPGRIVS